jgi:hypothetical protein
MEMEMMEVVLLQATSDQLRGHTGQKRRYWLVLSFKRE